MARTEGFVGTIEVETRNTSRIWFSLTSKDDNSDWVEIAGKRAWFTLNLDASDRPMYMAELSLIKDALEHDYPIQVTHEGAAGFHKRTPGDSYETTGVRILRAHMHF